MPIAAQAANSVRAPMAPAAVGPSKRTPNLRWLRLLVFSYVALWIFEGALRKWIFPGLANPLLIVRDPVLLLIYALAYAKGTFPRSAFIPCIAGLGLVATFVSLFFTPTPLTVTLYGLRSDYLHLPLIFLLPEVLRRSDLRLIGKGVLIIAMGMAVLVVLQFRSSAGSRLNAGAGENTSMLESAFGHVRPSGTFSYTNGLSGFTALTAAVFLQHLLEKRVYPRLIWLGAIPALLLLIVLSGSRGAAVTTAIILLAVLFISVVQRRYRTSSLKLVALVGVGVFLIGSFAVFKSGLEVFSSRFQSNNVEQHGMVGRYTEGLLQPFTVLPRTEWAGVGLGMGTNVAAGLISGERKFTFSEGEGGRVVLENGPIIGLAFLLLRLCILVSIAAAALRALRSHAATLPLLLLSGCYNDLMIGQFSQATELGFVTITSGLCLAASRTAGEPLDEEAAPAVEAAPRPSATGALPTVRTVRGRGAHAVGQRAPTVEQPRAHE